MPWSLVRLLFIALLALPSYALAQSTAQPVTPGYLSSDTTLCPNAAQRPCFVAYGNGIPLTPATTGGLSVSSQLVANNTTSVAIKASAGQLYGIEAFNNSATIAYIKLYNAAQGSTTCGSGTPVARYMIPANAAGAGFIWDNANGVAFATALTACVTTGYADADTSAPAASAYIVNYLYK